MLTKQRSYINIHVKNWVLQRVALLLEIYISLKRVRLASSSYLRLYNTLITLIISQQKNTYKLTYSTYINKTKMPRGGPETGTGSLTNDHPSYNVL